MNCYLRSTFKDSFSLLFMNMFNNSDPFGLEEIGNEMGCSSIGCASILLIRIETIAYWGLVHCCQSL